MNAQRYDLPIAVTLRLHARSGKIELIAEPREDVLVEGDRFEAGECEDGASFEIRAGHAGSKSLSVRCPAGTDVVVGTQGGNVRLTGDFGSVSVTTMSGDIDVDTSDEADLRTASGTITLAGCRERCRLNSMSGGINAGDVGAVAAGTMSGSITIAHVAGKLKARSVSGSIRARLDGEGTIAVKTVRARSNSNCRRAPGSRRASRRSPAACATLPVGTDCQIEAMTVSGSIDLVPG